MFKFAVLPVVAILALAVPDVSAEVELPPRESVHVYLLMGQSNMAGRGEVAESDKIPHPRVVMFNANNEWVPMIDPVHFDKPQVVGVGPGSQFGREMAEAYPQATIALVPCAVGGTPLSRWQKGADLYEAAVVRAKAAMKDGTLKGAIWHQGEGDSSIELGSTYAKRLDQMIADLRADLGVPNLPFVVGELAKSAKGKEPGGKELVVTALRELPKRVPNTGFASSEGCPPKSERDQTHFSSEGARELGRRYAKELQRLLRH